MEDGAPQLPELRPYSVVMMVADVPAGFLVGVLERVMGMDANAAMKLADLLPKKKMIFSGYSREIAETIAHRTRYLSEQMKISLPCHIEPDSE